MIYNLALVFGKEVHNQILEFSKLFQSSNACEFEYTDNSVPHTTLIKYDSKENPFSIEEQHFTVTLSGLTLLPSRKDEDEGTWVEISVLINRALRSRIDEILSRLDPASIKSEVGDQLRPHITVCKLLSQSNVRIHGLNPNLFRMSNAEAKLVVGTSKSFGFALNL